MRTNDISRLIVWLFGDQVAVFDGYREADQLGVGAINADTF